MTQRDFANRYGVGLSTLSKWLRDENKAVLPPVRFQEVVLSNPPPHFPVEVVSPQGWIVRLQKGFEIQSLSKVLQALPC